MDGNDLVIRFNDSDSSVTRAAKKVNNYASLLSFCDAFLLGKLA